MAIGHGQVQGQIRPVPLLDFLKHRPGDDLHASFLQTLMHFGAYIGIKTAQHFLAAIDQAGRHAETGKHVCELYRNVSAPCDNEMLRKFFQMENLVRGNCMLNTRQLFRRGSPRTPANGHQNFLCRHGLSAVLQA